MIYNSGIKNGKANKYRVNIQKNNKNYSIVLYVVEEKLQVSIKYTAYMSEEIFEYTNFYSFHQLHIINKYFRYFDNLEQISKDLDKLLKNNKVSIDEKNDFLILSIQVLLKNEKTNIVFKLLRNKINDFSSRKKDLRSPYFNKDYSKSSISMPKYNVNDNNKELKSIINDLNDRISVLENSRRYDSLPKEKKINQHNINMNDNKIYLNNLNNMLTRINKLEDLNQEKDNKIKELEDQISKYEGNISNIMSYPIYSIPNKSQKSRNENSYYINKKKISNRNSGEYEVEINPGTINESMNRYNDKNEQKLRSKRPNKKPSQESSKNSKKYYFNKIEENGVESNKKQSSDESYKDENSRKLKKYKSKSQRKNYNKKDNSSISKDEAESDDDNKKNKKYKKNKNKKESESEDDSEDGKNNNKDESDNDKNNIRDESEKSSEKKKKKNKKRKNSDSSDEKKLKNKKKNNSKLSDEKMKSKTIDNSMNQKEEIQKKMALTGLNMVEREDLKNYVNSRIFYTKKELQMVKNKIVKNKKHLHAYFEILYRASIDGDFEDTINSLCEGIYPQLILFYTDDGARFGIYIEKEKHTSFFGNVSYREVPGTSFLISLNSLKTYNILEGKKASDDREEKLCFGRSFYYNDNGSNWLINTPKNDFLRIKCIIGDKESSFGNINTNEIVGINKEYFLQDVEIFKVIIYPEGDDDEDENNKYIKEKEIKIKNYSKNDSNNNDNDSIKIKNVKIENEEGDQD